MFEFKIINRFLSYIKLKSRLFLFVVLEAVIYNVANSIGDGGHGLLGFRGGDQQACLRDEGVGLNLRQACDTTCDKLTTPITTRSEAIGLKSCRMD